MSSSRLRFPFMLLVLGCSALTGSTLSVPARAQSPVPSVAPQPETPRALTAATAMLRQLDGIQLGLARSDRAAADACLAELVAARNRYEDVRQSLERGEPEGVRGARELTLSLARTTGKYAGRLRDSAPRGTAASKAKKTIKPAGKPAGKPPEKPADKPADKPAKKPADKPADKPPGKTP